MINASAITEGGQIRLLRYSQSEHPVALQLGGSEEKNLARAAISGAKMGYDEINLNVGCPSSRVQSGKFGASLMAKPETVFSCIRAMKQAVDIPVTVKTRLGIDDLDSYEFLKNFIEVVSEAGCRTVIIHARKAFLAGLSPKENREIPPLNYERVHQLKKDFPMLEIIINGGINNVDQALRQLQYVDGVMLGREVYKNPFLLGDLDLKIYGTSLIKSREDVFKEFLAYMKKELDHGTPFKVMTRHLSGLYAGYPGCRAWRRFIGKLPADRYGYELLKKFSSQPFQDSLRMFAASN
tara:strand:- start:841 stop:1725 length:885 start_codon:yes stop_codon:yes gene_type:complete